MISVKKTLSLIMALLMLSSSVLSCSDPASSGDTDKPEETTAGISVEETLSPEDAEALALYSDLPVKDFGGEKFTILTPTHSESDFIGEQSGETIRDAVYKRNLQTETDLKIDLNIVSENGLWGDQTSYLKRIESAVLSDEDAYNLISGYAAFITTSAQEGLLANWLDATAVNFDKPWWNSSLVEELTINDRLYYITGDLTMTSLNYLMCIFFNKELLETYRIEENLYELVKEGKWTLEKLIEFASVAGDDLNGDGKITEEFDQYGFATDCHNFVSAFQTSFGAKITVKGDDGRPVLAVENEDYINKFGAIYPFHREAKYTFVAQNEGDYTDDLNRDATKIFVSGRALFETNLLGNASSMRNVDIDFGILPYPKYDEAQEDYLTHTWDAYNLFCIPTTAPIEMTGIVAEYMAALSYQIVYPAFYETALKTKMTRDEESGDMIELIRSRAVYNFGQVYSPKANNCDQTYRLLVMNSDPNIASHLKSLSKSAQKLLDRVVEKTYFGEK